MLTLADHYAPLDKQNLIVYSEDVCKECPKGAKCHLDQITVQEGYWRGVSTSTWIVT